MGKSDLCKLVLDAVNKETDKENMYRTYSKLVPMIMNKFDVTDNIPFDTFTAILDSNEFKQIIADERLPPFKLADRLNNTLLSMIINRKNISLPQFRGDKLSVLQSMALANTSDQRCVQCKRTRFFFSVHQIGLTEIGDLSEVLKLNESNTAWGKHLFRLDVQESRIHLLANDMVYRINRVNMFKSGSEDEDENISLSMVDNWFYNSKEEAISFIKMIANQAEQIFGNEPRVLNVSILLHQSRVSNALLCSSHRLATHSAIFMVI